MAISEEEIALIMQAYANADPRDMLDGDEMTEYDTFVERPWMLGQMNFEPQTTMTPYMFSSDGYITSFMQSPDPIVQGVGIAIGQQGMRTPTEIIGYLAGEYGYEPETPEYEALSRDVQSIAQPALDAIMADDVKVASGEVVQGPDGAYYTTETEEHPYMRYARNAGFQYLPGEQFDYENEAASTRFDNMARASSESRTGLNMPSADELDAMQWQFGRQVMGNQAAKGRFDEQMAAYARGIDTGNGPAVEVDGPASPGGGRPRRFDLRGGGGEGGAPKYDLTAEYGNADEMRSGGRQPGRFGNSVRAQSSGGGTALGGGRFSDINYMSPESLAEQKKRLDWLQGVEDQKAKNAALGAEFRRNFEREQQEIYNRNMAARGLTPHTLEAIMRRLNS